MFHRCVRKNIGRYVRIIPLHFSFLEGCRCSFWKEDARAKGERAMSPQNRTREIQVKFYVTEHELKMINLKMRQAGTTNREAYLRKMAIDGFVLKLDIPELKELVSLMRYMGNNTNQIAKRLNEGGNMYQSELSEIQEQQEQIWEGLRKLLIRLGEI